MSERRIQLPLLKENQADEKQQRLRELVQPVIERDYRNYFKEKAMDVLPSVLGEKKWDTLSDAEKERLADTAANRIVNMLVDQFVNNLLMTYGDDEVARIIEDMEAMERDEKGHLIGVLVRLLSGGELRWDENIARIIREVAESVNVQKSFRRRLRARLDLSKQEEPVSEETIWVGGTNITLDALVDAVAMAAEKLQNLASNRDELKRILMEDPQYAQRLYEILASIDEELKI